MVTIVRATYSDLASPIHKCIRLMVSAERAHQLAVIGLKSLASMNPSELPRSAHPFGYSLGQGFATDRQRADSGGEFMLHKQFHRDYENSLLLLSEQAVISLWSSIEVLVNDFSIMWIPRAAEDQELKLIAMVANFKTKDLKDPETIAKIRRKAPWLSKSDSENQRGSVRKFEKFQIYFGLNTVEAPPKLIDNLAELEAVRHIIVHNSSIIDNEFQSSRSGSMKISDLIGQRFVVTDELLIRYQNAVWAYIRLFSERIRQNAWEIVSG